MRDEDRKLKRQAQGDGINIDALMEARRDGIHPDCITIDTEARVYLPHMYGAAANRSIVERVEDLPRKVSDIYRRLTT